MAEITNDELFEVDDWIETSDEPLVYNREEDSPEEIVEPTGSFSEAFAAQRDEVHVMQSLERSRMETHYVEPEFVDSLSLDKIKADTEVMGILDGDVDWLSSAPNQQEYNRRLSRSLEIQKAQQAVENAGGVKGALAVLSAYATDPVGFAVDAAAGGSSKANMLWRFIEAGGRAAIADIGTEMLRMSDGEPQEIEDLMVGTLTAFGTAGILGQMGRGRDVELLAEQDAKAYREAAMAMKAERSVGAAENPELGGVLRGETQSDNITTTDWLIDRAIEDGKPERYRPGLQIGQASRAQNTDTIDVAKALEDVHGAGVTKAGTDREIPMEVESIRLKEKFDAIFNRSFSENFKDYQKEIKGQTGIKGAFTRQFGHRDAIDFQKQVGDYMLGLTEDVPAQVKKVGDDTFGAFRAWKEHSIKSGLIPAEKFSSDARWMPRMFTRGGVSRMLTKANLRNHTDLKPLIVKAITNGRRAAGLEVDEDLTEVVATAYLNRAWKFGDSNGGFKDSSSIDFNDREFLTELINEHIPEENRAAALSIVDSKTGKKANTESDQIDNLKSRVLLDPNASMDFNGVTVTMAEIYENDIGKIWNSYNNKMAGDTAFRQRGWSAKQFEKYIEEKRAEANLNAKNKDATGITTKGKATPKDVENLEFAYDRMMHRGIRPNNENANKALKALNDYTYSTKMGSSALNAVSELMTAVAVSGLKGFWKNSKFFKDLIGSYAGKNPPKGQVKVIQTLSSGIADRVAENRAKFNIQDDIEFNFDGKLGKTVRAADGLKRIANETNMLSHVTDMASSFSNATIFNRLDEWANGAKMPGWWENRAKSWGVFGERAELIKKFMTSDYVKRDKSGAIIDFDSSKMDFQTQQAVEQVMHRATSRIIQKIYSGDLPKIMQNPLGAFIMKFRSFTTAAWGNHTLDDMNHKDMLALSKLLLTGSMGMLMYANRTYLTYPTDESKRREVLTWENALRSGATYAVNASILPAIADTFGEIVLGSPIVGKRRTSGLSTSLIDPSNYAASIPGISVLSDMYKAGTGVGTLFRGGELDKSQVKAIFSLAMLDTLLFTRGVRAAAVEAAPNPRTADRNEIDILQEFKDAF